MTCSLIRSRISRTHREDSRPARTSLWITSASTTPHSFLPVVLGSFSLHLRGHQYLSEHAVRPKRPIRKRPGHPSCAGPRRRDQYTLARLLTYHPHPPCSALRHHHYLRPVRPRRPRTHRTPVPRESPSVLQTRSACCRVF